MKKSLVIVICLVLILILSVVSFTDFWDKITGKTVDLEEGYSYKCNEDSDEFCNWYAGDYGESCVDVCASHGGVKEPYTWNDDFNCTVMEEFFGECQCNGEYADERLPSNQDNAWCLYRKDTAQGGVDAAPDMVPKEGPGLERARRICACNELGGVSDTGSEESEKDVGIFKKFICRIKTIFTKQTYEECVSE